MSKPFLFVSHVTEDREAAMELVGELERRDVNCWIAPRDVRPGAPFDDQIAAAIDDSRAMLLVFSGRCNDSEYIRREVTVAGEARKLIIPLRIEEVQPLRGLRMRLSDLHWIDGFVAREQAIDAVISAVQPSPDLNTNRPEPAQFPSEQAGASEQTPDPEFAALLTSAEAGDVKAQSTVGSRYYWGNGVPQAYDKALYWCLKAAEHGDAVAHNYVGSLYERGLGCKKDLNIAIDWYTRSAKQDYHLAELNLGILYEFGKGLKQDYKNALEWYSKAEDHGSHVAILSIANMYQNGNGIEKDYSKAIELYRKVAERLATTEAIIGIAEWHLGRTYENGLGVLRDSDEAVIWYRKAASRGNAPARAAINRLASQKA